MALNWAMLDGVRAPVPLPHEMTITSVESGVELALTVPGGTDGSARKLKETGKIWVTDQRVIFVGPEKSEIQSLSIPLHQIVSSKFEQPMFGANSLVLGLAPSPDGGLTRGTAAEIRFRDAPLFGFVRTLEKTREHALETRANNQAAADEADGLPAYTSSFPGSSSGAGPSTSSSGVPPPPPDDAPPGYDV